MRSCDALIDPTISAILRAVIAEGGLASARRVSEVLGGELDGPALDEMYQSGYLILYHPDRRMAPRNTCDVFQVTAAGRAAATRPPDLPGRAVEPGERLMVKWRANAVVRYALDMPAAEVAERLRVPIESLRVMPDGLLWGGSPFADLGFGDWMAEHELDDLRVEYRVDSRALDTIYSS